MASSDGALTRAVLRAGLPLVVLIAGCASAPDVEIPAQEPAVQSRFATAGNDAAWVQLTPGAPRLPTWARVLADSLPATTSEQLNLNYVQRARNPLGAVLSGELRWVVADANRCDYAKQAAEADLAAAGRTEPEVHRLADIRALADPERALFVFARKLTLAAAEITDAEVEALIGAYGPDDAVAIVHTVAHANFEQRIWLALGLTEEPGGAVPARLYGLPAEGELPVPAREAPVDPVDESLARAEPFRPVDDRSVADVRDLLERQKLREPRITKPDAVRMTRIARPFRTVIGKIAWGTVSLGYSPDLTNAWFQTMDRFMTESNIDEVFRSSVFWVMTRSTDCFY